MLDDLVDGSMRLLLRVGGVRRMGRGVRGRGVIHEIDCGVGFGFLLVVGVVRGRVD